MTGRAAHFLYPLTTNLVEWIVYLKTPRAGRDLEEAQGSKQQSEKRGSRILTEDNDVPSIAFVRGRLDGSPQKE